MLFITQIILFISTRCFRPFKFLDHKLKVFIFIKHCYQLATKEQFGRFPIDLNPKTSVCLRYCSNITELGPTWFYPMSDKAEMANLNNEREKITYDEAHGAFEARTFKETFA